MEINGITYTIEEIHTLVKLAVNERERQRKKVALYRKRKNQVHGTQIEEPVHGTQIEEPVHGTQIEEPVHGTQIEEPVHGTREIHKYHQKYNSQFRDDSLDIIDAVEGLKERVLQRERDGSGIKIPKLI
jgi:hypothetical protein